jgi:hypothetical protein
MQCYLWGLSLTHDSVIDHYVCGRENVAKIYTMSSVFYNNKVNNTYDNIKL